MYETINSPINYGGLELKNRIIFAPTTFGLAEDEYFEKIRKIAAGGCAMVIMVTSPSAKANLRNLFLIKKASPIIRSWPKSSTAMTAASAPSCTRPTPICWPC